jgi:signal transduction histidine kinase
MLFGLTKKLMMSFSLRVTILFSATFSLCLITALVFTYYEISNSLEKASQEVISAKWLEASTILTNDGLPSLKVFLLSEQNRLRNTAFLFRVLNQDGKTLFIKPSLQDESFDFEAAFRNFPKPSQMEGWHAFQAINDEDRFDIFTGSTPVGFYLQVGRSSEDRENVLERIISGFSTMTVLFIFLSGLLGFWYAKKSMAPIRMLSKTMASIERGDLSRRVPTGSSHDELNDLGDVFNRMISRIDKLVSSMKESLSNVSHDIRTPLTRVRVIAERALLSKDSQQSTLALEECAENIEEITALVDQLLDIAEAESGVMTLKKENVSLQQLFTQVVDIYEVVAEEKNIKIKISASNDLNWLFDRKRIKQAVANLLDNAIKYSDSNTQVSLSAFVESNLLAIKISDQGTGISSDDLPRIWERLYRGDKSRSTKGLGLGLSLVRSIVQAHAGTIEVNAGPDSKGSVFTIFLPTV